MRKNALSGRGPAYLAVCLVLLALLLSLLLALLLALLIALLGVLLGVLLVVLLSLTGILVIHGKFLLQFTMCGFSAKVVYPRAGVSFTLCLWGGK